MVSRRLFLKFFGVWLGVICPTLARAQNLFLEAPSPQLAAARVQELSASRLKGPFYFGVMGQVARPGVYELENPEPQLVDVIQHAGGLTQQATNTIRVVRRQSAGQAIYYSPGLYFPLIAGDILVADGALVSASQERSRITPRSRSGVQTADFVDVPDVAIANTYRQVALMNVLDRPVILPVHETNANVPAVVAYLKQNPSVAGEVQVLPVDSGRVLLKGKDAILAAFSGPTVLYFNPSSVQRYALPQFPEVYRVGQQEALPEERKTAERMPVLSSPALSGPGVENSSVERFQRPVPHAVVVLPNPMPSGGPELPLIAKVRELEQQIPSPKPLSARRPKPAEFPSPTPVAEADIPAEDSDDEPQIGGSSWWPYLGLLGLVLVAAGIEVKRRWHHIQRKFSAEAASTETSPSRHEDVIPCEPKAPETIPPAVSPAAFLTDAVLAALLFNQLPVREERAEPAPAEPVETKPHSRKIFRIDPPEEQKARASKEPYIVKRPPLPKPEQAKPAAQAPAATHSLPLPETSRLSVVNPGKLGESSTAAKGLLDRVLQRVHQNRAA